MEKNKSGCEEIIAELNEYKELLWNLSDEYKENVGAAEKKANEEIEKREALEKELKKLRKKLLEKEKLEYFTGKNSTLDLNQLGLPACILNEKGALSEFNYKFKFFVELLLLDIEEVTDLFLFAKKISNQNLAEKISEYFNSDKNIFQAIFSAINSFKQKIYVVLRIYRNEITNKHLALWIELQANELKVLQIQKPETEINKNEEKNTNVPAQAEEEQIKFNELHADIRSYAKRYEISSQLLSFINKKINKSTENINLIREIYNKIEKSFNLKKEAAELLKQIESKEKDFIKKLKENYPELTTNEQKHCLLIKEGLTYKEIAALMEISVNGVKIARNRLRKKLKLDADIKTSDFIAKL